MILEASAIALGVLAVWRATAKKPIGLTSERRAIFEAAMSDLRDPAHLRELAKAFRQEGLAAHATLLEKRAGLQELPPAVKAARRAIFKKAINSKNPDAVEAIAATYAEEGAIGAAKALREYAAGLRAAGTIPTIPVAPDESAAAPATPNPEPEPARGEAEATPNPHASEEAELAEGTATIVEAIPEGASPA